MAITNNASLQAAILNWMDGRTDLAAEAPNFVRFATDLFNYGTDTVAPLRVREMEEVASLSPVNGIATLPADYLQYRRVVETLSPRRNLSFISPDRAEALYPSRTQGPSSNFTVIGGELSTFPLASTNIELTYYQLIPHLDADGDTNWLLDKHPQAYLRAALIFAWDFVRNTEEAEKNALRTSAFIDGLNRTDLLGNYARGGAAINGPTP